MTSARLTPGDIVPVPFSNITDGCCRNLTITLPKPYHKLTATLDSDVTTTSDPDVVVTFGTKVVTTSLPDLMVMYWSKVTVTSLCNLLLLRRIVNI